MTEERSKIMDDLIAQDADMIDNPLIAAVRELLTDDSQVDLGAFINDLVEALDRHGLQVVSQIYIDWQNDTIRECKDEIKGLREALKDALSHCYNCSGDPRYIEEDEATGNHLWTDCPVCRSARAALGEQQ